jgi:Outer membrane protein beta-barrel domain
MERSSQERRTTVSHTLYRVLFAALLTTLVAAAAPGQTLSPTNGWTHGTTVNVFSGAARADADTQPMIGASIGWEISPAIAIEGSGYWFDHHENAERFAAALKLQVGMPGTHPIVPFLAAGVGLYRASFDPASTDIPAFYRDRIGTAGATPGSLNAFTDPSFVFGGGVNFFVSRHIAIRPDVEAMWVRRNAQGFLATIAAVHLAYHFEDHPITPRRMAR